MLPKAGSRSARRHGWSLFGRRGNRRVRASSPVPPRPPRPPLWASAWGALKSWRRSLLVAAVGMTLAASAWGGRWYVTHARHFAVRQVRVSPTVHVSAEALIARANVPLGVNLFAVKREDVARAVSQEPWVARAHVRRELPSTLMIDVVEREPACAVAFGALYLADADGNVFKRATPEEAAGLAVVTGIGREEYVSQPERSREELRQALAAIAAWRPRADGSTRSALGEVHVDRIAGVTVYTESGVGVRLGAVDETLAARLARYDAVAAALQSGGEEARLVYVDNRARPDRVTVKLASAQLSAHSGSKE
ncbi:MAG: FtsQ-type POTRA domain-containing protein [Myxococcales bacterium]|nr:FtsQ-type POTRA domain-containing protein [Myxococcales bacterium]